MKKFNLKSDWFVFVLLALFSFILGILLIRILPPFPVISDFLDYDNIAKALVEKGGYITISTDNLIYPPLYPIFLSIIYRMFGYSYSAVYLVQFIFLGVIAFIFYKTGKKYIGLSKTFSILVSLTIIIWPYMMLYSLVVSSEILFILFLSIFLYLFLKFVDLPTRQLSVGMGIAIGLAVLTRPVALLLPLWLIIGVTLLHFISYWKLTLQHFKLSLLSLLVFIITLLPWIGFVYLKFDRLIPVASNLSAVTDKANNSFEYLKGTIGESLMHSGGTMKETLEIKALNVILFWNPGASGYNVASLVEKHPKAEIFVTFYKIGFIIIVLLGLGSMYYVRTKRSIALLLSVLLYFWSVHTVLFPFPRYTLPIIPILILLAFYMLNTIIEFSRICLKKY
ncbi:MAG: glycosyltransferase family 39 protein [Patescibacteria group bacterium]